VVPLGVSARTAWGCQAEGQRASVGTCSSTRIWGRGRSHASTCVSIACIRAATRSSTATSTTDASDIRPPPRRYARTPVRSLRPDRNTPALPRATIAPTPTNPRSPHRHRHVISPTPGRTPLPPTCSTRRKHRRHFTLQATDIGESGRSHPLPQTGRLRPPLLVPRILPGQSGLRSGFPEATGPGPASGESLQVKMHPKGLIDLDHDLRRYPTEDRPYPFDS